MNLNSRQELAIRRAAIVQSSIFAKVLGQSLVTCGVDSHTAKMASHKIHDSVRRNNFTSVRLRTILLGTLLATMTRPNGLYGLRVCRNDHNPIYISKGSVRQAAMRL